MGEGGHLQGCSSCRLLFEALTFSTVKMCIDGAIAECVKSPNSSILDSQKPQTDFPMEWRMHGQ